MYAEMSHDPRRAQASYTCLIDALTRQWEALATIGYHFILGDDVYTSSQSMFDDVTNEHRLIIFDTHLTDENMPEDHPMLGVSDITAPREDGTIARLTHNDVFRGVHDLLGHYLPRNQFGPLGEYRAWLAHMASLPEDSWMALFCETRGQNAWTNYADQHQELSLRCRPFPEQKAGWVDMDEVFADMQWPAYSHHILS
jgi:hypothetical protein